MNNINLKNLEILRLRRNLTQADIADVVGVSTRTVLRWEKSQASPTLEDLKKIACLFKVSISYLIGEQSELEWWWKFKN